VTNRARPPAGVRDAGGIPSTRSVPPRRPRAFAPELVAAILAVIVVAVIGGGLIVGGTSAVVTASGPPQPTESSAGTAGPTPVVDETAITALLTINDRLTAAREALDAELTASTFAPSDVQTILLGLNADVIGATRIATILQGFPASATVGAQLTKFYTNLHQHLSDELAASVQNAPAYRSAAKSTSTILADVPALNAALEALLIGRTTASSSPSGSIPPPVPSASAPASATPTPVATPRPSAPPSGGPSLPPSPPAVANDLANPGFESGVGPPWELSVSGSGAATWTGDPTVHAGGTTSARVDISVAGDERAAIAVRQGGLSIVAGSRYVAAISARADTPREVRLRIASAAGDTYATRLFTVGPAWQVLTIDSTVFATDPDAYLEIDLGRFAATTWLDDASFGQVAATGG
jgi:hypothetical protein